MKYEIIIFKKVAIINENPAFSILILFTKETTETIKNELMAKNIYVFSIGVLKFLIVEL